MSSWTTCEIIERASSNMLLSVDEAKKLLGVLSSDKSQDELLKLLIEMASGQVAAFCNNRVFAREKVVESFYDEDVVDRLFLSRFPVVPKDIEEITQGDSPDPFVDYKMDES